MTTPEKRVFKTRAKKIGGHVHVTFFVSKHLSETFANIGTLVMDETDYLNLAKHFEVEQHFYDGHEEPSQRVPRYQDDEVKP